MNEESNFKDVNELIEYYIESAVEEKEEELKVLYIRYIDKINPILSEFKEALLNEIRYRYDETRFCEFEDIVNGIYRLYENSLHKLQSELESKTI